MLSIDTVAWVAMHRRIVKQAQDLMGRLPYREYTFLYEDGPGGGLEHLNSTTLSSESQLLAKSPTVRAHTTAHEFFHAWNVKRIRPIELGPFAYDRPVRTLGLWWAEGVTDFFADELLRRAGLQDEAATKRTLAVTIQEYLNNPGHDHISPERSSWTAWDPNTVNHGYNVSYYTTGALLGSMLDLALRHATDGVRGMDDVERALFDHYAGETGYTETDLRNTVNTVCGCDMGSFFTRYVSGHGRHLISRGILASRGGRLSSRVAQPIRGWTTVGGSFGLRSRAINGIGSPGGHAGGPIRLAVRIPDGSFGKAGLIDGDTLLAVNGKPILDQADFSARFANAKVGDRYRVAYMRGGIPYTTTVTILPYETVHFQVVDLPDLTSKQRIVRARWLRGPEPRGL